MAILKLVVAFFVCFGQIIGPLFTQLTKGEEQFFEDWSADTKFTQESYIELEKNPDEDFVILNLTDIQLGEENVFGKDGEYSFELIRKLVLFFARKILICFEAPLFYFLYQLYSYFLYRIF
jgi:hypothetical protein